MGNSDEKQSQTSIIEAARKITLIAFDVDGVLTDGRIGYTSAGEEIKSFNVRDGHAIKIAFRGGLSVAVITGRESPMVRRRCEELGIELLYEDAKNKHEAFKSLLERTGVPPQEVAYMGDDVVDLPVMMSAGLGCCPCDASEEVCLRAELVTHAAGGNGAARELIFLILRAKGLLDDLLARYLSTGNDQGFAD